MALRRTLTALALTLSLAGLAACQDGGARAPSDPSPLSAAQEAAPQATATWRSALYPTSWTPAFTDSQGRFFHDFSYAGYHNSETALGLGIPATTVDVTTAGADPTGASDSTAAINAAIRTVSQGGGVVYFPAGLYRVDGTLAVTASNVVLRGAGPELSRVYFTQSEGLSYKSHISIKGSLRTTAESILVNDGRSRADYVEVSDPSLFTVGDDVAIGWVITEAFIADHDMEDYWEAFNDTWQPFFWREIVDIDTSVSPARLYVDVPLRYVAKVRDFASVRRTAGYIQNVGVEELGLANAVAWSEAWAQSQIHVLEMIGVKDGWVREVRTFTPPTAPTSGYGIGTHLQSGGILISNAKRVTVADTVLQNAEHRGDGGNGYLFEIRQSSEILTRDCEGHDGRHNFIQNWGFGTTGCVWLRVWSSGGRAVQSEQFPFGFIGFSEFHHSLATANLIDSSTFDDGWSIENRRDWSTGAGVTGTETVMWNTDGRGALKSYQFGWGYVVGTGSQIHEFTKPRGPAALETAPQDYTEGLGEASTLEPQSLFEDMLSRRLGG